MKHQVCWNIVITVFFTLSLLWPENASAKDSIQSFSLNLQFNHFIAKDKDSYFDPIDPGFEVLYKRKLNSSLAVLTGVNYSFSRWYNKYSVSFGTKKMAHEVAIPLLFEWSVGHKTYVTVGSYAGWLVSGKVIQSNKFSSGWKDITNYSDYSDYSESSKFTMDLYLDFGFFPTLAPKHPISFAPFIKYKIVDNWMEEVRAKINFGLNVKYVFGL